MENKQNVIITKNGIKVLKKTRRVKAEDHKVTKEQPKLLNRKERRRSFTRKNG